MSLTIRLYLIYICLSGTLFLIYVSLYISLSFYCSLSLTTSPFQTLFDPPRAPSPPPLRAFRQPLSTSAQPPIGLGLRSAVLLGGSAGAIDVGPNLGPGLGVPLAIHGHGHDVAGARVGTGVNTIGLRGGATRLGLGLGSGGVFDIHIAVLPPSRRYATFATLVEVSR